MENLGLISLLPTLTVIVIAIVSKRSLEPLVAGVLVGFIILSGTNVLGSTINSALTVLADETIRWIILAVGLFGALTSLLVYSKGASAFSNFLSRFVKSDKSTLMVSWVLGLILFIDDYLNALTVGSSMKKLCDKFKVSRQMLAYVVDTTAAPICVLIPLSTWAIYVSGLLEANNVVEEGNGISLYISSIPYMIYPMVAVVMIPLVIYKIMPIIGPMKVAEQKVKQGKSTAIKNSTMSVEHSDVKNERVINFFLPIFSLLFFTWYFDIDVLKGVIFSLIVTFILFALQRLMPLGKMFDVAMEGFKSMIPALAIVVVSFMLKDVNDQMGLTEFIISSVEPYMSKALLPIITFISLAFIAFASGSFWGVYAIAFPIILPLGEAMNVDLPLLIGTIISAGAFGSHACFYGDSTVLSAVATDIETTDHALTQFPFIMISALISLVILFIIGSI